MMVFTYLSTNYYKPKNDYIQSPFKNETFLWGGIQIQSADKSADCKYSQACLLVLLAGEDAIIRPFEFI